MLTLLMKSITFQIKILSLEFDMYFITKDMVKAVLVFVTSLVTLEVKEEDTPK